MGSENKICFLFPSTHPRRVWLHRISAVSLSSLVSIHTPTKGVTWWSMRSFDAQRVSIHTPTKGVTRAGSHAPGKRLVSIHTPTKGVTENNKTIVEVTDVSIHTPTKGVTLCPIKTHQVIICFNPHTHEGCDRTDGRWFVSVQVSIHTPTKGVTARIDGLVNAEFVSIHTPTKGVTNESGHFVKMTKVSIHTPTKGVTAYSANSWISWCKDNYFAKDGKIITRKIL